MVIVQYSVAFMMTFNMGAMVQAKNLTSSKNHAQSQSLKYTPSAKPSVVPLSKQLQKKGSTPSSNEEQPQARFAHFGPSPNDTSLKDGLIPIPPPPPPLPGKNPTKQTQATFVNGCTGNCQSYKSKVVNYQTCLKTEKQSQKDKCQSLIRKHITTNCNRQIPLDHYQTTEQTRLPGCSDNTLQNTQMAFVIEILSIF